MADRELTAEEIAERGEAIYERDLRPLVEEAHRNRFLVLDIDSGDYEIDDDDLKASDRLLLRRPHGLSYGLRIGHRTAYKLLSPRLVEPTEAD